MNCVMNILMEYVWTQNNDPQPGIAPNSKYKQYGKLLRNCFSRQ